MSIYDKTVTDLTTGDLEELLTEGAVENVRLEFKREAPGRDETLKKLSSFANTYGGYLVVGAEAASSDGRLISLPGIDPAASYKQKIIQWCYEGVAPILTVYVSDAIPSPVDSNKACYVIFVPESQEGPHFINSRKGVYVRTDEFSQRFEARLATYSEIAYLANRRRTAEERKERLFGRSVERFNTLGALEYAGYSRTDSPIGTTMEVFICPQFPVAPLQEEKALLKLIDESTLAWRQVGFPRTHDRITQHESVLIPRAAGGFSLFEISTWGHLYYAYAVESIREDLRGIHVPAFVGHLLLFLEHARGTYGKLGFDGTIEIRVVLKKIRGIPWIYFSHSFPEQGPASPLDDELSVRLELPSSRLPQNRDGVTADLLRTILFALNWQRAAHDDAIIESFLKQGYKYNNWRGPTERD